jgi:pseudaminic acid biosynthesis-associated methylase
MSKDFQTDQEAFWAGSFGDEYSRRNAGEVLVARNAALFARILSRCAPVSSVIEFGSNIGLNLRALRTLLPGASLEAIEINASAVAELRAWGGAKEIHHRSILEFSPARTWDLVLIKGVLIHIEPEKLAVVYRALHQAAGRYLLVVEYYNPTPVEVVYRGHHGKLFKRDFAGEMLDAYPDLRVLDYGFVWRRDPAYPQDDCSWFLLEKTAPPR